MVKDEDKDEDKATTRFYSHSRTRECKVGRRGEGAAAAEHVPRAQSQLTVKSQVKSIQVKSKGTGRQII